MFNIKHLHYPELKSVDIELFNEFRVKIKSLPIGSEA